MFAGFPLGNQIGDFGLSALGLVEPGDQRIVAFLVFRLVEGDMCVFIDAVFDELGSDVDFRFQLVQLSLKGCGVEALHQDLLVYGYELFFLVNHLIGGPEEQFFLSSVSVGVPHFSPSNSLSHIIIKIQKNHNCSYLKLMFSSNNKIEGIVAPRNSPF